MSVEETVKPSIIARRVGLIPDTMRLEASRYQHLPDFHPHRSEQSEHAYNLINQLDQIDPPLSQIQYLQLLNLVFQQPLEEIEAEFGTKVPTPPNPYMKTTPTNLRQAFAILSELRSMHQGASLRNKTDMLWRIAVRNEAKRPDLSIAAINAMNKTQIAHGELTPNAPGGSSQGNNFTLILQNPNLLNAPLDQVEEAEIVDG